MGQLETTIVRIHFPQPVFWNREYFHYIMPRLLLLLLLLLLYSSPTEAPKRGGASGVLHAGIRADRCTK